MFTATPHSPRRADGTGRNPQRTLARTAPTAAEAEAAAWGALLAADGGLTRTPADPAAHPYARAMRGAGWRVVTVPTHTSVPARV